MQLTEKSFHMSVRLPEWLIKDIDKMAQLSNRTRSNMVETILRERVGKRKLRGDAV